MRETWLKADDGYHYKANATQNSEELRKAYGYKWKPSIHMPKEATRIFLRVTGVRAEQLFDITEEQAEKEGACKAIEVIHPIDGDVIYRDENGYFTIGFKSLWDSTIKKADLDKYGWGANPYVWVYEFERIDAE